MPDEKAPGGKPARDGDRPAGPGEESDAWESTGLDLARAVAREVAGRGPRVRGRRRRAPEVADSGQAQAERSGGYSGAAPDERDPQGVKSVVERLVAERGWRPDLQVAGAVARWPHVVGAQLAEHAWADSFHDGVLTVRADSTSWATQVRLMAPQILARLCADIGDGVVTRIEVHGPSAPSWRHGRRSVRGRGPRDTYG